MDKYRVALPKFHGPLDLLLHLVKRNEVDVRDIPMAVVTDQFRAYLEVIQVIDVELAGDFLVTAAMLMEIKSKMLLPQSGNEQENSEVDDPRTELVQQLIEYQRMRQSMMRMETLANQSNRRFGHIPVSATDRSETTQASAESVELWDLLSAFGRIMHESEDASAIDEVDTTPQHVYCDQLMERIRKGGRMKFRDAFTPPFVRHRLVGVFLAILELIKTGVIILESVASSEDIWLIASGQS